MKRHELLIAAIMFGLTWAGIVRAEDQPMDQQTKPTIVLVHGAWADSSSWNGVVDLLLKDGYTVRALRILCADSPQTPPSSQHISNPSPDPLFW
jgi:pimeloyl-ACP methyl ester carboxylesterase